jgi:hypothetical protein
MEYNHPYASGLHPPFFSSNCLSNTWLASKLQLQYNEHGTQLQPIGAYTHTNKQPLPKVHSKIFFEHYVCQHNLLLLLAENAKRPVIAGCTETKNSRSCL